VGSLVIQEKMGNKQRAALRARLGFTSRRTIMKVGFIGLGNI
jgi:hypothetical protein